MKQAVICPFFGRLRDRFCEYGEDLNVVEKLERIAKVPGVQGVEIVYPHELNDLDEVKAALERLGLAVAAINVNVKSDPGFEKGSITSPDPALRAQAVEYLKRAKDAATVLGSERITCCPLSDGYDYPFHVHYASAWDRMVEVVSEAASYRPEITLHMEYKPFETRVHNLLSSAARTILLCQAAGEKNVGGDHRYRAFDVRRRAAG
ncbi:D-apiose isomerase [subsurface metagenome]